MDDDLGHSRRQHRDCVHRESLAAARQRRRTLHRGAGQRGDDRVAPRAADHRVLLGRGAPGQSALDRRRHAGQRHADLPGQSRLVAADRRRRRRHRLGSGSARERRLRGSRMDDRRRQPGLSVLSLRSRRLPRSPRRHRTVARRPVHSAHGDGSFGAGDDLAHRREAVPDRQPWRELDGRVALGEERSALLE